ncbi:MAG: tRNA lysidine(34) synthetase TilS [Rhodocyclaceae bacterium]|jgi:tRNA(Ile)-lysidine synthase|nr:tRNA lysidine(34) synthetase TilS [Rhodocyclaceae bacterium]
MASSRKSLPTEAPSAPTQALAACLARHVLPGQHLVLGLSGGIDSIVLLHALAAARSGTPAAFSLAALHVHHGLSVNADRWEAFCRGLCERLDVPFACAHVIVERGSADGLEGAARRARHAAFVASAADWVVLAQHRDDQAETLLFNLLRGTGMAGAAAMRERSGRLLRPLLPVGRADIEAYARQHGLDWVEDESNADLRHARNFLRHRVLPELHGRFPAAAKNMAAAAARFAEALALLDALARIDLDGTEDFPLDIACLDRLDEARARNVLRYLLARRQVMIPGEARLAEAVRQMRSAGPDRHPALVFGDRRLYRRRGRLYLEPVGEGGMEDSGDSTETC